MISFASLNYGLIFILFAGKQSHSQDIDFFKIEENLLNTMRDIRIEVISLQTELKQVKTSVDTLDAKSDFSRIEENLISKMKDIRSEIVGQQMNLNEVNILVNTLSIKSDLLMRNQDAVQSKSEKALLKVEEKVIKYISEAAKHISQNVSSYFLMNNKSGSQSQLEKALLTLEEKLLQDFSEAAKNISLDLSIYKDFITNDHYAVQSKLEKALMKGEENLVGEILNAAKNISLDVSLSKDFLMNNQYAVQLKLEKGLLNLKEMLIEKFSEAAKNISQDGSFCKDAESYNAKGNLTNLILEKISSQSEDIKKILNKKEKPPLPFGNDTHSNEVFSFRINKTGKENSCTDFSKTFLSIVNALFHINISQHRESVSNFQTCWKDLPKSMEGHTYFVTPKMKGDEVTSYCENHGGKPFIPKSQEEFIFYVAVTTEPETENYSWYPINDIKEEGHLVLHNGTDYENSIYKLEKWEPKWPNSDEADCATMNIFGEGSWTRCYHYDFILLCQGN